MSEPGKSASFNLFVLNAVLYLITIAIASWAVNRGIRRSDETASVILPLARIFPMYYPFGNMATGFVVIMSLIAGVVGFTTSINGIYNLTQWNAPNMYAAAASCLLTWLLTLLAMGLACKEIQLGWKESNLRIGWIESNLRALEAILIILSGTQLLCYVAIHVGAAYVVARDNFPWDS